MHESASPCHNVMVQWSLQSCKTWFKTAKLNTDSWASRIKHSRLYIYNLCAQTTTQKTCYHYGSFIVLHRKPLFKWLQYPLNSKICQNTIQLPLKLLVGRFKRKAFHLHHFPSFLFWQNLELLKNLVSLMVTLLQLDQTQLYCAEGQWSPEVWICSSGLDMFHSALWMVSNAVPLLQLLNQTNRTKEVMLEWTKNSHRVLSPAHFSWKLQLQSWQ